MSLVDEALRMEWTEETNTRGCNKNKDNISLVVMRGFRVFCQRESNSDNVVFFVVAFLAERGSIYH